MLKKTVILILFGAVVMIISAYLGNKYTVLGTDDTADENYYENSIEVKSPDRLTINSDTVLEFQYNYTDGITTTQCMLPAKYMTDYDRGELADAYSSWQMESFSPVKVVFVKNFDSESTQHYILKEYKGYVGVFYRKSGMLKELTSTPVASLSEKDREKYSKGVEIDGDENLMKYIEGLET